jgi:hypothetical protein
MGESDFEVVDAGHLDASRNVENLESKLYY